MSNNYVMQAVSSTSGAVVSWVAAVPDFAGSGFPGPGSPLYIAVSMVEPAEDGAATLSPAQFLDQAAPGTPAIGGVLYSTAGLPYWKDTAAFVHQMADYRQSLNADLVGAASATLQSTNLTFPVQAGDVWEVEFGGDTKQASGAAGIKFGFACPAGSSLAGRVEGSTTSSALWTFTRMIAINTGYGTFNTVAATDGTFWGKVVITCAIAGTVVFQIQPGAAVAPTLYAGAFINPKRIKKV